MKFHILKAAVAALVLAGSAPAFAGLIHVSGTNVNGTGLGAVSTLATVQDNGTGNTNGTESGCVSFNGFKNGNLDKPNTTCPTGASFPGTALQGGDNTGVNAVQLASDVNKLTSASQIALVLNISEGQPGNTATLTDLYLSLFNLDSMTTMYFTYDGADLVLGNQGSVGQSGDNLFILDDAQAAMAAGFCPNLSRCVIGGGMQFLNGSTESSPETMYVTSYQRPATPVPEPLSLALVGAGLLGIGAARSRRSRG